MPPVKVLIVDDEPFVCSALSEIFSYYLDLEVVGMANDAHTAVAECLRLRPQVVLMDLRMPVVDGIAATASLCNLPNPPRILMMTSVDDRDLVVRAVEAGALGFVLKDDGATALAEAVRRAARGEPPFSLSSMRHLVSHVQNDSHATRRHRATSALELLSDRELEVVIEVARGHTNDHIAATLHMSVRTVKSHLSNASTKLQSRSRVEIGTMVERAGLL